MPRRSAWGLLVLMLLAAGWLSLRGVPSRPSESPALDPSTPAQAPPSALADRARRPESETAATAAPLATAAAPLREADRANPVRARRTAIESQSERTARLEQMLGCVAAQTPRSDADRLAEWANALPDEALDHATGEYAAAQAWAGNECPAHSGQTDGDGNWRLDTATLLAAGFAADDPLVSLQQAGTPAADGEVDVDAVRAALYQTLARTLQAPNVLDFLQIARVGGSASMSASGQRLGPYVSFDEASAAVWMLAACDLGADCGPQSGAMRLVCLTELLCGYPSLEAAVIDAYWPQGSVELLQRTRRDLVARLRQNAGAGLFEPTRPGGG